jgi:hypothetical protein
MLKNINETRKILSFMLVLSMLICLLSVIHVNAVNNIKIVEYDNTTYILEYPTEIEPNVFQSSVTTEQTKIVTINDKNNNTFEYIYMDLSNGTEKITKQFIAPLNSIRNRPNSKLRVINQLTETSFGYGYYYNTDSANLDNYWRLYCPDASPSSNFFFTEFGSGAQIKCDYFVEAIHAMDTQNQIIEQEIGSGAFNRILNLLDLILGIPDLDEVLATVMGITHSDIALDAAETLHENREEALSLYTYLLSE